ncbi:hypothetical protein G6F56_008956 [Rhizopus delemar]|nr:hypothetical protein G6F56_008956 [Rhizopus delemar]
MGTPLKEWTSIKFSPAENYILIITFGNTIYDLDAFIGKVIRRLVGNANPKKHVDLWRRIGLLAILDSSHNVP